MEYIALLGTIVGIATLIVVINMSTKMVQMGESIRRMRTQIEEVNEYVFYLPREEDRQGRRTETGLVDMPYPRVRPSRVRAEE